MGRMKALTMWQPWASLLIGGFKAYETRSWKTDHRGWLAIHAAKQFPVDCKHLCLTEPFRSCLKKMGYHTLHSVPKGKILGCVYINEVIASHLVQDRISEAERAFGDFSSGRWAWRVSNIYVLPPIPATGAQRIWNWDAPDWLAEELSERN